MQIAHRCRTWAATLSIAAVTAVPALAAEPLDGRALYLRYCSACHGSEGRGDGVVSGAMRPKPTDLTAIAKASPGGAFPVAEVAASIDGAATARAHGDPDMPVWGEVLRENGEPGSGPGKIIAIAEYLKTIQVK